MKIEKKEHNVCNYLLLSNAVALFYQKTKNLKFLNVLLKLNDTHLSIHSTFTDEQSRLLYCSIQLELAFVNALAEEKGVEING